LEFIRADYTFLNERLAKHYGIPNVHGSHFRRVTLTPESRRGGLLSGHALAVTSYATRTRRDRGVCPRLFRRTAAAAAPERACADEARSPRAPMLSGSRRIERTRCANRHRTIDPAASRSKISARSQWRSREGEPIDSSVRCQARRIRGGQGPKTHCSAGRDVYRALTEKLLTFGLGRGIEYYDAPGRAQIVRTR
jgi:hypothetical protein